MDVKRIVEAILFSSSDPVSINTLSKITELKPGAIFNIVEALNREYEERGNSFRIRKIGNGFQMVTLPEYGKWVARLNHKGKRKLLTKTMLETLAIIAYNQPVTKPDIDKLRGVDSGWVIGELLEKGFIKIKGRDKRPGNPFLYVTTQKFLEYFGLSSLDELPKIEEFDKKNE